MRKCPFCNIELKGGSTHVKVCGKKFNTNLSDNEIRFEFIKYNFPEIANYDILYDIYVNKKICLPEIRQLYKLDFKGILFLLDYFKIERRTSKQSLNLKETRIKCENSCIEKYGSKNVFCKDTIIYHKRNKTVKEKYGVNNVFQIPEVIEKITDDNYYLEKYNLTRRALLSLKMKEVWKNKTEEEKFEWLTKSWYSKWGKLIEKGKFSSNLERRILNILFDKQLEFVSQYRIKNKFFDFHLINTNILIEVNGDYWHANPLIYNENDLISYPGKFISAKEVWQREEIKKQLAISNNYIVVYLWENEINKSSDDGLIKLLNERIKNETTNYKN
jgi:hypothetical protein